MANQKTASMMQIHKYRTHGNDYIVIDNRTGSYDYAMEDEALKSMLCNRVFGIGAIGICEIKATSQEKVGDPRFQMVYHLATGPRGKACGTGTRCSLAFAQDVGVVPKDEKTFSYITYEGIMNAIITGSLITQTMSNNCCLLEQYDDLNYFLDVDWWVHVRFVEDGIMSHDIVAEGLAETDTEKYQKIRSPSFILAEVVGNGVVNMRCFDRTAKDYEEMYACGTGGVSMSIAYLHKYNLYGDHKLTLIWRHGVTKVTITRDGHNSYSNITLSGHSRHVFSSVVDTQQFKSDFLFFQDHARHLHIDKPDGLSKFEMADMACIHNQSMVET